MSAPPCVLQITRLCEPNLDGGQRLVQLLVRAAHKLARPLVPGRKADEVQGGQPGLAPGAHEDQHRLDGGVRL